jgi:hypothetical protein
MAMQADGRTLDEMQLLINGRYGHIGPSTDLNK